MLDIQYLLAGIVGSSRGHLHGGQRPVNLRGAEVKGLPDAVLVPLPGAEGSVQLQRLQSSPRVSAVGPAMFAQGFLADVWGPTDGLEVPALFLWATHGDFPRKAYEAFVERLPAGRIQDIEGRHLIPMEDPDPVVRAALAYAGIEAAGSEGATS